jgi:hypothetical protein
VNSTIDKLMAENARLHAMLDMDDKLLGLQSKVRETVPWPLNFALMAVYHAGVEWTLCWDEWRDR